MKVSTSFTIEHDDLMGIKRACRKANIPFSDYIRFCTTQTGLPSPDMHPFMYGSRNQRTVLGAYATFKNAIPVSESQDDQSSRESTPSLPHEAD